MGRLFFEVFKFPAFWLPVLFLGIGLDSCIIPLRHEGLWLVQTTDFFYPLVDDPFLMVFPLMDFVLMEWKDS